MKKLFTVAAAAVCLNGCVNNGGPSSDSGQSAGGGLPTAEFQSPSMASRPETWFHFIGGNVAKAGITADLESIKGAGISGIQLFHGQFGGAWPGVEPQIKCLSEPWDGLVGFVADECKRLGLRFTMQNCPGWAMSGGPWIKPENAMRHLVWKRVDAEGGKRIEVKLPTLAPSAPDPHDYRDIAVLAFPATAGQWNGALAPKSVTGGHNIDWNAWAKDGKAVQIPAHSTTVLTFEFPQPVTARTLELPSINSMDHGWCYDPETTVRCEANGRTLIDRALPGANWQDDRPVSFAIDETTAKTFTVTLKNRHAFKLGKINFFSSARNDDWEAQAGWTLRKLMRNAPAKQGDGAWVKSAEVRDVTKFMKPDGTFAWDAPAGKWAIVRVGHANTMRKNGPAPKEGTGFECDKLATKGADVQFDNYIGRLSRAGGAVHGKIANMLMDSWECKRQTWTPGLDRAFAERMGYDIFTWMPAIFGYVVDSPEATARFLNDWREFIAERIADNFYGRMAKRCHENGMTISFETSFGDVIPGDVLRFYKHADTPMCEFWQPRQPNFVGSFDFKPVKPCVSAAHLYGKKGVAAEAFTSFSLTWDEKLRNLKYIANIHLAEEVTHMVFHTYTHNPRTDWLPPGTSFGSGIGTPFLRGQTWWKFMPDFTAYLGRCQAMLEAGNTVRDVLWYLGDEWDERPPHDMPFPEGHRYDYCNPDALLTRLDVNAKGEWQTPEGTAYRVLYIPARCRRMMPETMEKIAAGVRKGGVAAFAALPEACSTLRPGTEVRFVKALAELKSLGRLYVGKTLDSVFAAERIAPDFAGEGLVWNHRRAADADWYFVSPAKQNDSFRGTVGFRAVGDAEIWHPETGVSEKAKVAARAGGHVWVDLDLAQHEACFVVFRKRGGDLPAADLAAFAEAKAKYAKRISSRRSVANVLEARYGDLATEGRWVDVSAKLQGDLDRGETTVKVNNGWADCDPAYRTPKAFAAKIRLADGRVVELAARENGNVLLPGGCAAVAVEDASPAKPVAGPWSVRFTPGWGMPETMEVPALKAWKELGATAEAKAYSGTAEYSTAFTLDAVKPGEKIVLDLGKVETLASVEVNGVKFPSLWSYPYSLDVTKAVKPGANRLKVSVTDTWFNRLVYDAGQPEANRRTWTIRGPAKDRTLRDAGLIGPVRILLGRTDETSR